MFADYRFMRTHFDSIQLVVCGELYKQHYVFRLTQPFSIISSNSTYFDQSNHHQVFIVYKNLKLKVKI